MNWGSQPRTHLDRVVPKPIRSADLLVRAFENGQKLSAFFVLSIRADESVRAPFHLSDTPLTQTPKRSARIGWRRFPLCRSADFQSAAAGMIRVLPGRNRRYKVGNPRYGSGGEMRPIRTVRRGCYLKIFFKYSMLCVAMAFAPSSNLKTSTEM